MPGPVAQMTRLSGLAERSFTRRFREATGMAPLEYVHTLRLEEAKQMLESGEQPVEGIANEVGYEDAAFLLAAVPSQGGAHSGAVPPALRQFAAQSDEPTH